MHVALTDSSRRRRQLRNMVGGDVQLASAVDFGCALSSRPGCREPLPRAPRRNGGVAGQGTIFRISTAGLTTLYRFCSPNCLDGAGPSGGWYRLTPTTLRI